MAQPGMASTLGLAMLFSFSSDRCFFAGHAGISLAGVADSPYLHQADLQLFAGFFTDSLLAATTCAGSFVFRQLMDTSTRGNSAGRSEEHTSELQSRENLV